jgi:putative transcriptional regulator
MHYFAVIGYLIGGANRGRVESAHMPTPLTNRIAEQRKARHMTQEQLAHALGVSQPRLSQWENGTIIPRVDIVLEIADILGCKVEDLFTRQS